MTLGLRPFISKKFLIPLIVLGALVPLAVSAATFTQIMSPDAAYQASTTKIDISGLPDFLPVTSITDGTLTVGFSSPLDKAQVGHGWSTWSSSPESESDTPHVLISSSDALTMSLSSAVRTFGFEIEGNVFNTTSFDVTFTLLSGPTVVGTITRTVDGNSGARLMAATATGATFDQVAISVTAGSSSPGGFAIAQVRYDLVPTKGDILKDSGVPGNGIDKAPGLDKPFNEKSKAGEKAGKKK